ncbi:MAG: hypothetical protein EOP50_13925 [Sphingobacteriales bacterium]|nr:MAG: hypothetical protein EOP50_13925 [Sphingobacteriales bacterium]
MNEELSLLSLEALQERYADVASRLKAALLEGKGWEEVQELRHQVTDLETALHKRIREGSFNPAQYQQDREGSALPE